MKNKYFKNFLLIHLSYSNVDKNQESLMEQNQESLMEQNQESLMEQNQEGLINNGNSQKTSFKKKSRNLQQNSEMFEFKTL